MGLRDTLPELLNHLERALSLWERHVVATERIADAAEVRIPAADEALYIPEMAELLNGYPAPSAEAAMQMLDTPLRLVLEFVPEKALKFDGDRIAAFSAQQAGS